MRSESRKESCRGDFSSEKNYYCVWRLQRPEWDVWSMLSSNAKFCTKDPHECQLKKLVLYYQHLGG
jgi:hypothetical protein